MTGTERVRCKGLIRIAAAAGPKIDVASAEAVVAVVDTGRYTRILAAGQRSPRRYTGSLRIALGIKMGWKGRGRSKGAGRDGEGRGKDGQIEGVE